jgi:hypothetical protein
MTNQRVRSWEEWTEANSTRSQEEWIKDGFLEYGVTVHIAKPWVRFVVDAVIAITTIGGGLLVLCFIKRRVRTNIVEPNVVSDGGAAMPAGKPATTEGPPPVT